MPKVSSRTDSRNSQNFALTRLTSHFPAHGQAGFTKARGGFVTPAGYLLIVSEFRDLLASLAVESGLRGKQFEHICRWFLMNDPEYRATFRTVWLWDEWPDRWGADAGIDIVAEDVEGRLWAIQAKAYGSQYAVTKAGVDTFLSESSRALFSYRLLVATTDKLSPTARRTITAQEKPVGMVMLSDLCTADVDWPASPAHLDPSPLRSPYTPHPYQEEAIEAVVCGFEASDRGQLIMACGTGKTITAQFISDRLNCESTLVLVPSLSLLKQTMRVWRQQLGPDVSVLPVCSDESVSRDLDTPVESVSELGLPVTSDPAEIAGFLRDRRGRRVVFGTYQSSSQIAKAMALADVPEFDLVVADEAHRCTGRRASTFTTVLEGSRIRARRRLYMTATPRYFTGRVLKAASDVDFEVASMDDEELFGRVFHRLGFGEAIERDLLTDYRVVVVGVDDATYRSFAKRGVLVTRKGEMVTDARTLAGQIGLAKAMRQFDLSRLISFHSRVARARDFAAEMSAVIDWMPDDQRPTGNLWSKHASGAMSAGERHVLLQRLGNVTGDERGLLANARCLAEGVDVPTLDGVAFIDPRSSEVDIIQAVGRAIRNADNKILGTIVLPVFVDSTVDPDVALDDSAFKPVWAVLQALRAHDTELAMQIDALRREMGRRGGQPRLPDKIHLDVPVQVGDDFVRAFDARLVEQVSQPWEFWFGLLQRYVDQNGDARVLQTHSIDGFRLGTWVTIQRSRRSKDQLSAERRELLERLPGWSWDTKADQWEAGFRHLEAYRAEHGTSAVRDDFVSDDDYRLGKWVGKQRSKWRVLPADRKQRLHALPGWTLDARTTLWDESFAALSAYVEQNGHANPPRGLAVNDIDLESWVRRQRRTWKQLTDDRRERLATLAGWTLNAVEQKWDSGYAHLVQHVEEFGTAAVKQSYSSRDGYALGTWVSVQRSNWDKMTEARRERLSKLPGWTLDARGDWWDHWIGHLEKYVEKHGDCRVPLSYVTEDGDKLGGWVSNLRTIWDSLNQERQGQIQQFPGWTLDTRASAWEEGYRQLTSYVAENGHARVPQAYWSGDGIRLGSWVANQKTKWLSLTEERRSRLQQLPGWALNVADAQWNEGFERLSAYVEENGGADVRADCIFQEFRLGQWVTTQRAKWSKLDKRHRDRLEALPGWTASARDTRWEEGYEHLLRYVEEYGHACPPQKHFDATGFKIGSWVAIQRQSYAKGRIGGERRNKLSVLPGWKWSTRTANTAPSNPAPEERLF